MNTDNKLMQNIILIIGIVGSIASLISIPLAIYFYYDSIRAPKLTYYINPVKAVLAKRTDNDALKTLFQDRIIETDVTTIQVAIWNRGKESIKKDMILKPVNIVISGNYQILDAKIRRTSRDIVNCQLDKSRNVDGRLGVSWNIMEYNDGCAIQVMYGGNENADIKIEGVIQDQSEVERMDFNQPLKSIEEQYNLTIKQQRNLTYFLILFGSIFFVPGLLMLYKSKNNKREIYASMFVVLIGFCFIAAAIYRFFTANVDYGPPFGF